MRRYKKKSKRIGKYKSVLEAVIAKKLGRRAMYEPERIAFMLPKTYIPDFRIRTKSNKVFFLEVKGWFRSEDQQKMKAVKNSRPDLDIRFYFPNDIKVQGSKMTNSQWCRKHGFEFAIGEIPKGWLQ